MGSPLSEEGRGDDEMQHQVTLTKGFWMGETPVTKRLWTAVMGQTPSGSASDILPVENVSWAGCQEFLQKINAQSDVKRLGLRFALPTEAQWEYACRAGTTGPYGGTGLLDDMGWFFGNCGNKTHPVGVKKSNAWGLYDMHGNVWEWCHDWYGVYSTVAVSDPVGPLFGGYRVLRGGGSWSIAQYCRSAFRCWIRPDERRKGCGFRLVASEDAP